MIFRKLIFVCCFFVLVFPFSRAGDIWVRHGFMKSTDVYNETSTLLYSGQNLTFLCSPCYNCEIVDGSGQERANGKPLNVVLKEKSLSEQYFCKDAGSKSTNSFQVMYLLCEEGSETCNNMECTTDEGEGNRFCVMDKDNLSPKTCKPLPSTCDPSAIFGGNRVGMACVEGRQVKPLCQAFSDGDSVKFLSIYSEDTCIEYNFNIEMQIPSLKKHVYVGFIGRLGDKIEFNCQPKECNLNCAENSPTKKISTTSNRVTESFDLASPSFSTVTKITCHHNDDNYNHHVYLYNVLIDATVKFENISTSTESKFMCNFTKGVDDVDGRIKRSLNVSFFKNGSDVAVDLDDTFTVETCGLYVCQGTVKVRQCNPFFEATEVSNVTMEVTENCTDYEPSTTEPTHGPPASPVASAPVATSPNGKPPEPRPTGTPAGVATDNVNGKLASNFAISVNILLLVGFMFYFFF